MDTLALENIGYVLMDKLCRLVLLYGSGKNGVVEKWNCSKRKKTASGLASDAVFLIVEK